MFFYFLNYHIKIIKKYQFNIFLINFFFLKAWKTKIVLNSPSYLIQQKAEAIL
jgi:hypothetical protein